MEPITEIGQAVVRLKGKDFLFNPSFHAMSRIGTPAEIVDAFVKVYGGHYPQQIPNNEYVRKIVCSQVYGKDVLTAAVIIMQACCEDDVTCLSGGYKFTPRGKLVYFPGFMPQRDIITLAQHLMRHGVMGDVSPEEKQGGEYSGEFNAVALAYAAVAHLGISEAEAWNMTMTAFQAAVKAKYPPDEKKKVPSQADYDETMDWADKVIEQDRQRQSYR